MQLTATSQAPVNERENSTVNNAIKGKHVVITAGPTREALDPVRYISNYSSG